MSKDSRIRAVWGPGQLAAAAAGWCAAVVSVFFYIEGRMVPAAATGALFVVLTVLSQIIARSRRRKAHPSGDTAADGAGAPGMGMVGRKALSRNRAEVVHSLLGLAGSACAVAAVALFVAWDQVFLGILAGVAGFALIAVRQRVLEHSRLQEGMDAKAQWDREQAADPTESGLSGREENR